MSSIFLSHNHHDKAFVRRLGGDLHAAGIRVWIDEAEILIGDSLIAKVEAGIDSMDYLGVVLSKNSVQSEWVNREVRAALTRELSHRRVVVLPILIDDCEIPTFLADKFHADFRNESSYAKSLDMLLARLRSMQPVGALAAQPARLKPSPRTKLIAVSFSLLGLTIVAISVTIRTGSKAECFLRDPQTQAFSRSGTTRACLPGVVTALTWRQVGDTSACTGCENRAMQYVPGAVADQHLFTEYYLAQAQGSQRTWKQAHVWEMLRQRANRGFGSHEEGTLLGRQDGEEWLCDSTGRRLRIELFLPSSPASTGLYWRAYPVGPGNNLGVCKVRFDPPSEEWTTFGTFTTIARD